jgi:hypothetical protein
MGKAHNAPMSAKGRRFAIADHALDRLRERVAGTDLSYRDDEDLRHWLSQLCWERALLPVDTGPGGGDNTSLVDLRDSLAGNVWAVIRPNVFRGARAPQTLAIVTLLTGEMVDENFATGRWRVLPVELQRVL